MRRLTRNRQVIPFGKYSGREPQFICGFSRVMKQGSDLIERYEDKTKTPSKRKPAFNGTFSYFDLVRRDWRCFRVDALVELDRDYVL